MVQYFSRFGALINAYVIYMPGTEISKGFGYVEFASVEVASAVLGMRRHFIKQKKITVENHRQSYNTAMNFVQQRPSDVWTQENSSRPQFSMQEDPNETSPTFPEITFESATFNEGMTADAHSAYVMSPDVLPGYDFLQRDQHPDSCWDEPAQFASEFLENHYLQQGFFYDPPAQSVDYSETPDAVLMNMEAWTVFEPHGAEITGVSTSTSPNMTAKSLKSPQSAWQHGFTGREIGFMPVIRDEDIRFGSTTMTRNYPDAQGFTVDPCDGNPALVGYNHSQTVKLPGELSTGSLLHLTHPLEFHPNSLIRSLQQQNDSQNSLVSVRRWTGLHTSEDSNMVSKHTRTILHLRLDEHPSNYRFNISRR